MDSLFRIVKAMTNVALLYGFMTGNEFMTVGDHPHLALMVCLMGAVLTPFRVGVCEIRLCMICITKGSNLKPYF